MQIINAPPFRIEFSAGNYYPVDSADNPHSYYYIYYNNTDDIKPTSIVQISVFKDDKLLRTALIGASGGGTVPHKKSCVFAADRIIFCCANTVFCLSVPGLNMLWKTIAEDATCFEIFKYQDDYIVHGELQISRIGKNGEIIWQRSGADIFTTSDGRDDFIITENGIIATDWDHRKYTFDFDGKLLKY